MTSFLKKFAVSDIVVEQLTSYQIPSNIGLDVVRARKLFLAKENSPLAVPIYLAVIV